MFQVPSMKRLTVRGRLALLTGVAISTMLALPLADLAVGRPIDVISLCVAGVGALIVAALTRSTGRAVLPALAGITDAMTRLSNDEYGVKIPATKQEDEIGAAAARAIKTLYQLRYADGVGRKRRRQHQPQCDDRSPPTARSFT